MTNELQTIISAARRRQSVLPCGLVDRLLPHPVLHVRRHAGSGSGEHLTSIDVAPWNLAFLKMPEHVLYKSDQWQM